MNNHSLINRRVASFFYALAITVGIYIACTELILYNNTLNFFVFSFALLLIYFIELFTSFQNRSRKIQINLNFNDDINEISEIFHKCVLPLLLYISLLGFAYFNITSATIYIILLVAFFSFYILILNTKLFLEAKTKAESNTHYIYDIIKFLIFFLSVDTFSNLYKSQGANLIVYALIIGAISLLINFLMITRIKLVNKISIWLAIFFSTTTLIVFALLNLLPRFNPLQISLSLIFLFYISTAIIHHNIRKTLTKEVFLEYFFVIVLLLILTFFAL